MSQILRRIRQLVSIYRLRIIFYGPPPQKIPVPLLTDGKKTPLLLLAEGRKPPRGRPIPLHSYWPQKIPSPLLIEGKQPRISINHPHYLEWIMKQTTLQTDSLQPAKSSIPLVNITNNVLPHPAARASTDKPQPQLHKPPIPLVNTIDTVLPHTAARTSTDKSQPQLYDYYKKIGISFVILVGMTTSFYIGSHLSKAPQTSYSGESDHQKLQVIHIHQKPQVQYIEAVVPLPPVNNAPSHSRNVIDLLWPDIPRTLRSPSRPLTIEVQCFTSAALLPTTVASMLIYKSPSSNFNTIFLLIALVSCFVTENTYNNVSYLFIIPYRAVSYMFLKVYSWLPEAPYQHPQLAATHDLSQAAEDSSVFLTLFSRTSLGEDRIFGSEHQELLKNALVGVLEIQRELRLRDALADRGEDPWAWPEGVSGLTVNAECIICCSEIVDTVLLPCGHLILCASCCDAMEVRAGNMYGDRYMKCPLCRGVVQNTLKVFRG